MAQVWVAVVMVLLTLPALAALTLTRRRLSVEELVAAPALTFSGLIVAGWPLAAVGRLDLAPLALLLLPVVALLMRSRSSRLRRIRVIFPGAWVLAAVALVAVCEGYPVLSWSWPPGWDPACHAIVAQKIADTGRLSADWRPFETLPMNYPQGFHVLLVLLASWSGQTIPEVMQALNFLISFPAALAIFVLGRRIFHSTGAGCAALLAYALGVDGGGFLYYYRLGLFPTELGCYCFLVLVAESLRRRGGVLERMTAVYGTLLWCGMIMTHYLPTLIAITVLGVWSVWRPVGLKRSLCRLWGTLLAALVLTAPYYCSQLLRVGGVENTASVRFTEESMMDPGRLPGHLGMAALPFALYGLWWLRRCAVGRHAGKTAAGWRLLAGWLGWLFGFFVLMDYGFRLLVARPFFHEDFTLLIPSRFLVVCGYPLALLAGGGVWALWQWSHGHQRRRAGLIAILIVLGGIGVVRNARLTIFRPVSPELRELALRTAAVTPEDGFVVLPQGTPDYQWFPYLAWRSSLGNPIPSSENRALLEPKWLLFSDFSGNAEAIREYLVRERMRCYLLVKLPDGSWRMIGSDAAGRFAPVPAEVFHYTPGTEVR